MEPFEFPEVRRLHGRKAVRNLHEFIKELEERRGEELTDKQTNALIRVAEELISAIEGERKMCAADEVRSPARQERFSVPPYTEPAREKAREIAQSFALRFI